MEWWKNINYISPCGHNWRTHIMVPVMGDSKKNNPDIWCTDCNKWVSVTIGSFTKEDIKKAITKYLNN